jgi:hypothetical protein
MTFLVLSGIPPDLQKRRLVYTFIVYYFFLYFLLTLFIFTGLLASGVADEYRISGQSISSMVWSGQKMAFFLVVSARDKHISNKISGPPSRRFCP